MKAIKILIWPQDQDRLPDLAWRFHRLMGIVLDDLGQGLQYTTVISNESKEEFLDDMESE